MRAHPATAPLLLLVPIAATLSLHCGADVDDVPSPGDAASDTVADTGVADSNDDCGVSCEEPDWTPDPACDAEWIVQATGSVEADTPGAVSSALLQMCLRTSPGGMLACLAPQQASADGTWSVPIPDSRRCLDELTVRALSPGQGVASLFCRIDIAGATADALAERPFPVRASLRLPSVAAPNGGVGAMPGPSETRSFSFDDGVTLVASPGTLDLFEAFEEAWASVGTVYVDPAIAGCVTGGQTFDGLYAWLPEAALLSPGWAFTLPNRQNWEAGAEVELYVLGGLGTYLFDGTAVHEAEWARFGTAVVSEDGQTLVPDSGLPALTWLGYRRVAAR